jgi:hypothetical protein
MLGVPGTVGQVQERLVRAPTVQKPHGGNERAVQNPLNITLMTLSGMRVVSPNKIHRFQGDDLFHVHSMRCGGDEPNNLEDNK